MIGDPVREVRAHIGDTENIYEEFGKLVRLCLHCLHLPTQRRGAVALGNDLVLMTDRTDARSRRRDNGVDRRVTERIGVIRDQRQRSGLVAGVDVHLPAASLPGGKHDVVPETGEQEGGGLDGVGKHRVPDAGGEQRYSHVVPRNLSVWSDHSNTSLDRPPRKRRPPGYALASCRPSRARERGNKY